MFANYGLPFFEATRYVIAINSTGQPVDHIRNVVTITTADVLPNDGTSPPRKIIQPAIPVQFYALIYLEISQSERTPQDPTTTPKFTRTPDHANKKSLVYETKAGNALYKKASRSLYSDSEGKFILVI